MPKPHSHHARHVLALGLPLIGGHLAHVAIQLTDTLMLGWYSVEALAAQVLAGSLFFVLFIVGSGFAWAIVPMIAASHVQGDEQQVRRVTRMAMWLSVIYGCACLPLFWWSESLFLWMGQEPGIAADAQIYLRIVGPAIFPNLIVMVLKSYLSALEDTRAVFWISVGAAVINAAANYILIFGHFGAPELGIAGAALASVSMALASLAACVAHSLRAWPEHKLFVRLWRADHTRMTQVFRLGVPIGLTYLSEVGLFAASAVMIGWFGAVPLAAHGIVLQIATTTFVIHLGLSNAATIRAGMAMGGNDMGELRRGATTVIAISVCVSLITAMLFITVPEFFVFPFLDPETPDRDRIFALAVSLLFIAGVFQLVDGMQAVALGILRGMEDTRVPMVMAAISYWGIGAPVSYVLGASQGMGTEGIWIGLVFGLGAAAILLMYRLWRSTI